jgi:hypothetical protein
MLFECVGGEVAGGISVNGDESLRDFDEAADGGNEFVPVRRDEGHFWFRFPLCPSYGRMGQRVCRLHRRAVRWRRVDGGYRRRVAVVGCPWI